MLLFERCSVEAVWPQARLRALPQDRYRELEDSLNGTGVRF